MVNNTGIDYAEARLDEFAGEIVTSRANDMGYPMNQKSQLKGFYRWFAGSGLNLTMVNNAGDPFDPDASPLKLNTLVFEREVISHLGSLYGFDPTDLWGIVTFSGTDGNNHGIYFGSKYLQKKTGMKPVVYVSESAHYSNKRLADLQNLELKVIPTDVHSCMVPEELEKAIVPDKPALVVYAVGTTFKGGIDNMEALDAVFAKYPDLVVYRHVDAALFGGYLPYTDFRDVVNRKVHPFDSIAISGHKFFGMDEPAGFFITTKNVRDNQERYDISYLNCNMPMINCSRSAMTPLKFWWILQHTSREDFLDQTAGMLENAAWLKGEFDRMGWPAWLEPMSNTVYFRRPSKAVVKKYDLAPEQDERLGGELSHIVVMQHS
jgi:histidine decarboxylase